MTDSTRKAAAVAVRVLACLITLYAVLVLLFPDNPDKGDAFGYLLLVVGPLVMLSARWVGPPKASGAPEVGEAGGAAKEDATQEAQRGSG